MFDSLMKRISEQRLHADGAVERPEFGRSYGGDATDIVSTDDPAWRKKLEAFVVANTPCRHKYDTAAGDQGIVYFDSRGRAASCAVEQIPDQELIHIANGFSKRAPGQDAVKPQTSSQNHGYTRPVQEAAGVASESWDADEYPPPTEVEKHIRKVMVAVVDRLADDLTADAGLESELKRAADAFAADAARIYSTGFKKKLQQAKARGMH